MLKNLGIIATSFLLSAALAGCGAGSGEGLDDSGSPVTGGGGDGGGGGGNPTPPSGEGVSLSQIQSDIFTPRCSSCHAGGSAPRGLRLDSIDNSFNFLVNVAADEVPELLRVDPGDPDNSYLVRKIEGGPDIVGAQMPLGLTPLSADEIALVRQWISEGAAAPSAASVTTKISKVQTTALNDQLVFDILFNRELDSSSLDPYSVTLYQKEAGLSDVIALDSYEVSVGGMSLQVIYKGDMTKADAIELRLNDAAGASLYDINGLQIDGDNNQIEGGEYRYVYGF